MGGYGIVAGKIVEELIESIGVRFGEATKCFMPDQLRGLGVLGMDAREGSEVSGIRENIRTGSKAGFTPDVNGRALN